VRVIVIIFLVYVFLQSVLAAAFFPTLFALWLSALIVVPPALVALGYAVFLRRAGRIAPRRLLQRLSNELDPHSPIEASGATSFAELFSAAFGERSSGSTFRWRALHAYALSVIVLTLIWALAWPNDAARLLYGIKYDNFETVSVDPPLRLGRAAVVFLGSAVFFFPPFYVSLQLAHRALVPMRTYDPRLVLRRVLAATVGTVLAVLATSAIFLGLVSLTIQREYGPIGIVGVLKELPYQVLLHAAGYGYPSDGIFVYACFFALAWFALHAASHAVARRMFRFQRLANRLSDRPLHAIGFALFAVAFAANLFPFVTRATLFYSSSPTVPAGAENHPGVTLERVVEQFDHLVFGPRHTWPIEKHTDPLVVRPSGELDVAELYTPEILEIVDAIWRLTGLPARVAHGVQDPANFNLAFTKHSVFNRLFLNENVGLWAGPLDFAACITLDRHTIFIGTDFGDGMIRHCLPHEFMHAIGFYGHSCFYRPSVLCALDGDPDSLTRGDELLITALYDPRIENGMGREEALPIARTILRELMGSRALLPTQ